MNLRSLFSRAPFIAALAVLLALVSSQSTLATFLPLDIATFPGAVWLVLAILLALVPAWSARDTPLPAAALITVPLLAAGAYGASRLDWLRVLKDFDVTEPNAISFVRLALSALAVLALWGLHASDIAIRLRDRAIERGIARSQAAAASRRSMKRAAQAAGLALAGASGLLVIGIGGLWLAQLIPTERGALVAPLLATALLVAAALWLARGRETA